MTGKATLRRRSVKLPDPLRAIKLIKKGRQTLGGIFALSDGSRQYVSYQWREDIYKGRQVSISDAVANGEAGWALDTDLLRSVRRDGVTRIAIFCKDSGDLYMTSADNFFTDGCFTQLPWSREYRQARRLVKLDKFAYRARPVKV